MRKLFTIRILAISLMGLAAVGEPEARADSAHLLQVHMAPWFRGSMDWRTPNPDYEPPTEPGAVDTGFREFAVRWAWNETDKSARGELLGIRADGTSQKFWNLFAFLNPVTKEVTYIQTGTNGAYITGTVAARQRPLPDGEPDILDTMDYWPNGAVRESRHENVFAGGMHTSVVFERDESGAWQEKATWVWTLTDARDAQQTDPTRSNR